MSEEGAEMNTITTFGRYMDRNILEGYGSKTNWISSGGQLGMRQVGLNGMVPCCTTP